MAYDGIKACLREIKRIIEKASQLRLFHLTHENMRYAGCRYIFQKKPDDIQEKNGILLNKED